MPKFLDIAIPSGIGDSLWIMTKMKSLLKIEGKDFLNVFVCQDPRRRAEDFLRNFTFVSNVSYIDLGIMHDPISNEDGSYNYEVCQRDWHFRYHWFLQANNHLERGNRLEDWFPEWETDWNLMDDFQRKPSDIEWAGEISRTIPKYVVFYYSSEINNCNITSHNRNRLWKPEDWLKLQQLCTKLGLTVVSVGAQYDRDYYDNQLLPIGYKSVDMIGKLKIGRTIELLKRAEFVIGYQSGIVILAAFLGVNSGGFWRPYGDSIYPDRFVSFSENMASCWVPPKMLERKGWLPLIYTKCSPESIIEFAKENWLSRRV